MYVMLFHICYVFLQNFLFTSVVSNDNTATSRPNNEHVRDSLIQAACEGGVKEKNNLLDSWILEYDTRVAHLISKLSWTIY